MMCQVAGRAERPGGPEDWADHEGLHEVPCRQEGSHRSSCRSLLTLGLVLAILLLSLNQRHPKCGHSRPRDLHVRRFPTCSQAWGVEC